MIWQCQDCNSIGFFWTDEERDRVIAAHKDHGALGITVVDETEISDGERPNMSSTGPAPEAKGWTPGGTPDTGLSGGTPDTGKFSHPQLWENKTEGPSRREIVEDILRAWDEVKKERNL